MRKDYDRIERLASDIVMNDIKTLQAANAAEASHTKKNKNAQEKGSLSLLEGKVKDVAIQAEEGDENAQKTLAKLTGGGPKRKVKPLTKVLGQKLRIVGKKVMKGIRKVSNKLPDPFPEAGEKDAAKDRELRNMGVMPTGERYTGPKSEKKITKKGGNG